MNSEFLTKEGLLGVGIFLIPLGTNLLVNEKTLVAGIVSLTLGVMCIGFRAWLKTRTK